MRLRESEARNDRKIGSKVWIKFQKINNFISYIYIFIESQTMAEEEIRILKQKLQNYQIQYDNYKIQCKQIESFLEEESQKKQNQIRQLKEQAIKKQKQIGLMKTQINVLQLQNKQLKITIQQSQQSSSSKPIPQQKQVKSEQKIQKQQKKIDNTNISGQLEEANKKIMILQSHNQTIQLRFKQNVAKYTDQIHKLNEVIKQKSTQIEQLRNQLEMVKSKNSQSIVSQPLYIKSNSNSQVTTPKSNKNISFQLTQDKAEEKTKGGSVKKLEIKIERTGKNGSGSLFNQEKYWQLQEMYKTIQKQLVEANNKIGVLQQKINEYETHICQLENQLQHFSGQQQLFEQPTFRQNQNHHNNQQDSTLKRLNEEDDEYEQPQEPTFCTLIVAKKYYKSPFMEIEQKKNIRLYKTDKGGRIQKSLGSYKYKLNILTYSMDSLVSKTIQSIHKNIKNEIKSRVLIFGAGKTNKRAMMSCIVSLIKNMIKNSNSHQSSHKSINRTQKQKHYVKYLEVEDEGVINMQLQATNKPEIIRIIEHIQKQGNNQQKTKTIKKNDNGLVKEKKIRYFILQSGNIDVEIITSNFLDPDIKQADGLTNAINKMVYSKIPEFSLNNIKQEKSQTQIILAINPIIGCYQQCKQTLKIANCKRKRSERININDWRQSPARELYLQNSRQRRMYRVDEQSKREVENITIFRLSQLVEYYKGKFKQLVVEIKVILNTSIHLSYLKKSPAILNLQKILRFIQNVLNQNQTDILSLSRSRNGIEIQDEQTQILT